MDKRHMDLLDTIGIREVSFNNKFDISNAFQFSASLSQKGKSGKALFFCSLKSPYNIC